MKARATLIASGLRSAVQLALPVCLGCFAVAACAQANGPLAIQWDKSYGAPGKEDVLYDLVAADDGGLLLVGSSVDCLPSGLLSYSYWHPWVVRVDSGGNVLWEKPYGGSETDVVIGALPMADGGWLIGSFSNSLDGDRTGPYYGDLDYWLLRLDSAGQRLWDKSYGGDSIERAFCLEPTTDGGFLIVGESFSPPSGSKTAARFGSATTGDMWIVRVDSEGNQLWDQSFGGSNEDEAQVVRQTADGGFLIAGSSNSAEHSGNKSCPYYGPSGVHLYQGSDVWVVRLDANGKKLWDKSYGGTGRERVFDCQPTAQGGFALAGYSSSPPASSPATGNKASLGYGGNDYWLVWIDADGQVLWDQSFGGSQAESYDLVRYPPAERWTPLQRTADGGFLLAGYSKSPPSGNKTAPQDVGYDYWVVKLGPEPPFLRAKPGQPDGVSLTMIGPTNRVFVLQSSTDLVHWTDQASVTNLTGTVHWQSQETPNQPARLFRALMK